ncbi:DegV family protein [Anaeromonas gelatinilytica]|uniref:DegV family protein n=1 Tax=Anaeromonas gelatinilytica TaxID=2683194 RepID=UPI00207876D1|nr:DegV family protein [Anaeromonas gelatinilytica]
MKIISDSGCDLNEKIKKKLNLAMVPLSIRVDDREFIDDESLDRKELLKVMKNSEDYPKTASPSPKSFLDKYKNSEKSFVVTISSALSSTYSNAIMAKNMMMEEVNEKFIHVFDSVSASVGETLICIKLNELIDNGLTENDIVEKTNNYIKEMKTFFVLESLDNLIKAGRMSKIKGRIASVLSIKPIMGATDDGNIRLVKKTRGTKKSLSKLVDVIGEEGNIGKFKEKILGISHVNCKDRAEKLKNDIMKKYNFKDIIIVDAGGISTVYANEGGIIISF